MNALQLFEPNPHTAYTIDATSRLAAVPRHAILVYCRHGLVAPIEEPAHGYYFNDEAIRVLRRIEYLRGACGLNLPGVKMALALMNEVERLQAEVRFLRP